MGKLTTRLLMQASRAARKSMDMQAKITEAFIERYGVTYSDIDADKLIDELDYIGGYGVTLEECDRIMAEAGHPPKASRSALKEASDGE